MSRSPGLPNEPRPQNGMPCPTCGKSIRPGVKDTQGRTAYVCRQCSKTFFLGPEGLEEQIASPADQATPPSETAARDDCGRSPSRTGEDGDAIREEAAEFLAKSGKSAGGVSPVAVEDMPNGQEGRDQGSALKSAAGKAKPFAWHARDPRIVIPALAFLVIVLLIFVAYQLLRPPKAPDRSRPRPDGAVPAAAPGHKAQSQFKPRAAKTRPQPIRFTWENCKKQFARHVEPYEKAYAPGKWLDREAIETLHKQRWDCRRRANDLIPVEAESKRRLGDMKRQLRKQGLTQEAVQADSSVQSLQAEYEAAKQGQVSAKREQLAKEQTIFDSYKAARDKGIAYFLAEAKKLTRQYRAVGPTAQARLGSAELDGDSLQGAFSSFRTVCRLCIEASLAEVEAGVMEGERLNCAINGIHEKWCALGELDDLAYLVAMLSLEDKAAAPPGQCYVVRENLYRRARNMRPQLVADAKKRLDAIEAVQYPKPDKHVRPFAARARQVNALLGRATAAARDEKQAAEDAIAHALEVKRRTDKQVGKAIRHAFDASGPDRLALAQQIVHAGKFDAGGKTFLEAKRLAEQAPQRFQKLLDDRRSGPNCDPTRPQCVVVLRDCCYRVKGTLDRSAGDSRDHWLLVSAEPDLSCRLQFVSDPTGAAAAYRVETTGETKEAKGKRRAARLVRLPRDPTEVAGRILVCVELHEREAESRYEFEVSTTDKPKKPEKIIEVREWHPGLAMPVVDDRKERGFDVDLY